jgi:hypothetical protein
MEGLRQTVKNFSQNTQCSGHNLNRGPPKYKSRACYTHAAYFTHHFQKLLETLFPLCYEFINIKFASFSFSSSCEISLLQLQSALSLSFYVFLIFLYQLHLYCIFSFVVCPLILAAYIPIILFYIHLLSNKCCIYISSITCVSNVFEGGIITQWYRLLCHHYKVTSFYLTCDGNQNRHTRDLAEHTGTFVCKVGYSRHDTLKNFIDRQCILHVSHTYSWCWAQVSHFCCLWMAMTPLLLSSILYCHPHIPKLLWLTNYDYKTSRLMHKTG